VVNGGDLHTAVAAPQGTRAKGAEVYACCEFLVRQVEGGAGGEGVKPAATEGGHVLFEEETLHGVQRHKESI